MSSTSAQQGGWNGTPPRPFLIDVHAHVLQDLQQRLQNVRWPDEIPASGWKFGTELAYLRSLADYWRRQYDWRAQESALNRLPQFVVPLSGIDVHFIHEPGEGPAPFPLLLTHGWPGSFYEYHKLIPLLTRPSEHGGDSADSFTVVVPSMPGHGFSYRPRQPRFGLREISDTLAALMTRVLGHHRFGCFGYDWGAFVASRLAYAYERHLGKL